MAQAEAILAGGTSAMNLVSNSEGGSSRAQSSAETGGSRRQRRARRAHRTPSQISTKSLPAYKEEPGDEELVLVRSGIALHLYPSALIIIWLKAYHRGRRGRGCEQYLGPAVEYFLWRRVACSHVVVKLIYYTCSDTRWAYALAV